MYKPSNEGDQQIFNEYQKTKSIMRTVEKTGICYEAIKKALLRLGISHNLQSVRSYKLNQNYFNQINTDEKAYWLGFIAADGYVSQKRNYISIAISKTDKETLLKFNQNINSEYPVKDYFLKSPSGHLGEYSKLTIHSKEMVSDLVRLGIIQKKSLVLRPPPIEQKFFLSFLRGFFDGDGGISFHKTKRDNILQSAASITTTLEICRFFSDILNPYHFKIMIDKRIKNDSNNYTIRINGNYNVLRFCELIYENTSLYMERKYKRFLELKSDYFSKHKDFLIYTKLSKNKQKTFWFYSFSLNKKKYRGKIYQDKGYVITLCHEKLKEVNADDQLLQFERWYKLTN